MSLIKLKFLSCYLHSKAFVHYTDISGLSREHVPKNLTKPFHCVLSSPSNNTNLCELIDARWSACDTANSILHLRIPRTVIRHLQHMGLHHASEPNHSGGN